MPNLNTIPTWAWIAAAVLAFLWAKRKGYLDQMLKPPASTTPAPAPPPVPAAPAPVVEIRHVNVGDPAAAAAPAKDLTELHRVSFEFDVAVTPRPKSTP